MNLLADRETIAARDDSSQILVTPATDENDIVTTPLQPALVQHASTDTETAPADINHSHHTKTSPGKNTDTNPLLSPP